MLNTLINWDTATIQFIAENLRTEFLTKSAILISTLSEPEFFTVFVLLLSIFLLYKKMPVQSIQLLCIALGAITTTTFLKLIFGRTRPDLALVNETSFSFPSGHATASVAVLGGLAFIFVGKIESKLVRLLFYTLLLTIIVLISFSRLYLGVHYPSDIVAGWVVGSLWVFLVTKISNIKS